MSEVMNGCFLDSGGRYWTAGRWRHCPWFSLFFLFQERTSPSAHVLKLNCWESNVICANGPRRQLFWPLMLFYDPAHVTGMIGLIR